MRKGHSILDQSIQVGRLNLTVCQRSNRVKGLVISKHEENIRLLGPFFGSCNRSTTKSP